MLMTSSMKRRTRRLLASGLMIAACADNGFNCLIARANHRQADQQRAPDPEAESFFAARALRLHRRSGG
jgi:hypothetical protein